MKLLLFFALLFLLVCLALWAFSKLIKTWFNLETLLKDKKKPAAFLIRRAVLFSTKEPVNLKKPQDIRFCRLSKNAM